MTQDFGDFANIDAEEMLKRAKQHAAKAAELQNKLSDVVGRAESPDGHVKVTYTSAGGIADLEINPRAMRMPSADLADTIKNVIQDAAKDLQTNVRAVMAEIYQGQPDSPVEMMQNPAKMTARIEEVRDLLDSALGDASLHLEKLRRRIQP
ncbi:YbaB/EbfC family DNA-binding protein [Actinomadura spongiicola]|uniref:YbaB/EbfC family DNA-binding protein n=1 Tax=Actinomadura spongiicola TaxID=2303421 RepID=A0A372GE15_9ACTN|nr:YbaB/EbfC family nucleoid-associated protein [Actinomadura spongiicola]RFS83615.1 YbaB/EbfC family DNA-binding protein [Actinomadura spongiicola]